MSSLSPGSFCPYSKPSLLLCQCRPLSILLAAAIVAQGPLRFGANKYPNIGKWIRSRKCQETFACFSFVRMHPARVMI